MKSIVCLQKYFNSKMSKVKKGASAYSFFVAEFRKEVMLRNNPENWSLMEISKKAGERWIKLKEKEKTKYHLMQVADKKREAFQMKAFKHELKKRKLDLPKRPHSCFELYMKENVKELKKVLPGEVTKGNIHKFKSEAHKQFLKLSEEEKQRLEEVKRKEKLLYLREHRNIKRVFDQERQSDMSKWRGHKKKKTPEIKIVSSKATSNEFVSESDSDSD